MEAPLRPGLARKDKNLLPEFRFERKFLVDEMIPIQVEALLNLHPRLFYEPYPPRYVNNLYFDTPDLDNYSDHVSGASHRRKVRVRWYGDPFGDIASPMLEYKIRDGSVGIKYSYPLAPLCLDECFNDRKFAQVVHNSGLPKNVQHDLLNLNLVLFNRYHRRYYASRDHLFRATLDTKVVYYRGNGGIRNTFIHHQGNDRETILELKYGVEQEQHANRVAGFFPFRVSRNSKYVEGILRVYL